MVYLCNNCLWRFIFVPLHPLIRKHHSRTEVKATMTYLSTTYLHRLAATLFVALLFLGHSALAKAADTEGQDSTALSGNWIKQLAATGFHINDPRIDYPAFPKFALKVYNWGDRTFNHYDSTFVESTGKNWKAQIKNEMWMRTYIMELADRSSIHITSRLYDDLGIYLSFMAVSIGYSFNLNSYMGDDTKRTRFDFNFTCSRFAFNYWKQSVNGGAIIRKFGDFNEGHHLNYKFSDIDVDDSHLDLYYFFNNQQYSQAAAYCFSKYQLKSGGSWILGLSYDRHNMRLDFNSLPEDMLDALPSLERQYHFKYSDYCVLGGYARNWVLSPKKWLLNITALPFVGYKHTTTLDPSDRSIRNMLSTNLTMLGSVVYNYRGLFLSLQGRFNGFVNMSNDLTFFSSNQMLTIVTGFRF